jgi:DNA-binding MarR family transcriptional regulator
VTDEYRALAEFRYQIRKFLHFSEEAARASGLEPQHHQLLLAIKGLPDGRKATIREIAERLQLQHHSTVELINRLSDRGAIERHRSEEDRREVLIRLTRLGESLLRKLSIAHQEELEKAGPALNKALGTIMRANRRKGKAA